jgi:hypothetical protein
MYCRPTALLLLKCVLETNQVTEYRKSFPRGLHVDQSCPRIAEFSRAHFIQNEQD